MVYKSIFLNGCHDEGYASLQRWRGIIIALHMSVGELVDRHVGRCVGKSVSQKNCNLQQAF